MIKLADITKTYKNKRILEDISLEIPPGIFGLLGPNGAGKTTLMRILATVSSMSKGNITYNNIDWKDTEKIRKVIGYLPQNFNFYPKVKVREVLDHVALLKGISDIKARKDIVHKVLSQVNLLEEQEKKMENLSGGMVRRVGIAQAIIGSPQIILIDEPTAGLDPGERNNFRKLLRAISKDITVIISSHIVEDIESTCDKVAVLDLGKIIRQGGLDEIISVANDKVWSMNVSQEQFYYLSEKWNIVSSKYIKGKYEIRILSDIKPEAAELVIPTLEESYLYLMKGLGK
jgi:ABC-2 type transport system ATP-binding protein